MSPGRHMLDASLAWRNVILWLIDAQVIHGKEFNSLTSPAQKMILAFTLYQKEWYLSSGDKIILTSHHIEKKKSEITIKDIMRIYLQIHTYVQIWSNIYLCANISGLFSLS
jgi:hypothetical protein